MYIVGVLIIYHFPFHWVQKYRTDTVKLRAIEQVASYLCSRPSLLVWHSLVCSLFYPFLQLCLHGCFVIQEAGEDLKGPKLFVYERNNLDSVVSNSSSNRRNDSKHSENNKDRSHAARQSKSTGYVFHPLNSNGQEFFFSFPTRLMIVKLSVISNI